MKSKLNKIALALGSLALLGAATQAFADPTFPTFSISPAAIGAAGANITNLDTIKGGASERLLATSPTTFSGNGLLTLDGFYSGSTIKFSPTLSGKPLYVLFTLSDHLTGGTFGMPGSTYAIDSLNFSIYLDPQNDDVFSPATATADPNAGAGGANDTLVAFGKLIAGTATVNSGGGSTGGAVNSSETFSLCSGVGTATNSAAGDPKAALCGSNIGTAFAYQPSPFYNIVFDEFNNTSAVFTNGVLVLTGGSGSLNFAIPEPGSLALFGIAAVALGVGARRRRKA